MIKTAVFDIGGTLMEYKGMPCVWVDYYENGFLHVCEKLLPQLTEKNIADGMEILRGYAVFRFVRFVNLVQIP